MDAQQEIKKLHEVIAQYKKENERLKKVIYH